MTAWLAAIAIAGPTIIGEPEALADRVTFQAVVKLPELSPREELAVLAASENLLEGTEEYSKATLMRWAGQTGTTPHVEMMPGFVRIGVSVPPAQAGTGLSMLDSLLRRAQLGKEALEAWRAKPRADAADPWRTALWPSYPKARDLRMSDVHEAYRRYFRPENTTIAVGGAFASDLPAKAAERFADWMPPRVSPPPFDAGRRVPLLANETAVSTVEVVCGEFSARDADLPAKLLAAFALGVGKGSSLFRVVREHLRFSYRQEALLWPSEKGFRLRLLMARADPAFEPLRAPALKEAIQKDVAAWTEAHRNRALGAAKASLLTGIGERPIYLSGAAPLNGSVEDRTAMRAYWRARTGEDWDAASLVGRMETVSLGQLRESAAGILDSAGIQCILGLKGR